MHQALGANDFETSIFQVGHHVEFLKGKILFQEEVWRIEARHHAIFC